MLPIEIKLAIRGDAPGFARDLAREKRKIVNIVNRKAARRTRRLLKQQVKRAMGKGRNPGAGARLADSIIVKDTPRKGFAFENTSRVYSVARYGKGRSQRIDLLSVFAQGATIKPINGKWIAIPTRAAPRKANGAYVDPESYHSKYYMQVAPALALFKDARTRLVLWWLVPFVKIEKKIDADAAHVQSSSKMQADFDKQLTAAGARLVGKYSLVRG